MSTGGTRSGYALGLDVGTTGTKCILLDPEKGIVAETQAPSTLHSAQPGWAEEDPLEWWSNVGIVTRACLQEAGARPADVAAVGVSSMVPTLILLDSRGSVLHLSIQQNDARAHREIEQMRARVDEKDILMRTGSAITQQSIGPKLIWLRNHRPDVVSRAAHLMGSYDYIVYRLTGEFSAERNWALESGLFDLRSEDWDDALLEMCAIPRRWLGTVHWPADVVGAVTPEAAEATGLAAGTPVVAGSADHIASAYSAGLKSPGDLLVKLGGAGDILYSLDEPLVDERLFLDYHVIPGKYLPNGCMAASGSIIRWFREQFCANADYPELDREGEATPAGAEGLLMLPYFLGEKTPLNDPLARGVLFGLTLSHTRGHIYRAILEGISYGFRHHLVVLNERGLAVRRARVANGGARSPLWKQVTADVLGIPLEHIARHPGSSLGVAFVAGMGIGMFSSWNDIERFIEIDSTVEPNPTAHDRYNELFALYLDLYSRLKDLFPRFRTASDL